MVKGVPHRRLYNRHKLCPWERIEMSWLNRQVRWKRGGVYRACKGAKQQAALADSTEALVTGTAAGATWLSAT